MALGFDFRQFIHLRFYNKIFKFKPAFTLAEILITLGIIGIVAALTIPTLVHKYKIKVLKTRYTQTYAILSEALIKTRMELGENILENCFVNGVINTTYTSKMRTIFLKNCNYLEKSEKDDFF